MKTQASWAAALFVALLTLGFFSASVAHAQDPSAVDLEKRVRELEDIVRSLKDKEAVKNPVTPSAQPGSSLPNSILGNPTYGSSSPDVPTLPIQAKDPKTPADKEAKEKDKGKEKEKVEKPKEFIVGSNLKMEASWKNGLWFENADKSFRWTVGGVIQNDMSFFGADPALVRSIGVFNNLVDPGRALDDSFAFRRARLRFAGQLWEQMEFWAQYEFAQSLDLRRRTLGISPTPAAGTFPVNDFDPGDDVGFNEVYIGWRDLPLIGTIRVGRHRESLNFVTATADNNQVWMERGLMFDAFNGDFNFSNGITVQNSVLDNRVYYLLGFFHSNNNSNRGYYAIGDGEYCYDVRLTGLPVYKPDEQLWVHIGGDYSFRVPHLHQLRYRARPMVRGGPLYQTPNILNTGTIFGRDGQQIANLEFAMAWNRFTFAAEGATSWVNNAYTGGLPDPSGKLPAGAVLRGNYQAYGGYVEALCFLTPDHRSYQIDRPGYARVVPSRTWYFIDGENGWIKSWGAWEVGARVDYLDLNDNNINGGRGAAYTACVNWYFSSNARIQVNYSWMDRQFAPPDALGRVNGNFQSFGIRYNMDF